MSIAGHLAAAWSRPLFRAGLGIASITVLLDQVSKLLILHVVRLPDRYANRIELTPVFDLTYTENTGVSFGLFAGGLVSRVLLSVLAIVVSGFIVRWLMTLARPVSVIGAGMILGGAIGNLVDRVFYGYVVDFLDFSGLGFPYIFNVADAGINVGVALLLLDSLVLEPREARVKERQDR